MSEDRKAGSKADAIEYINGILKSKTGSPESPDNKNDRCPRCGGKKDDRRIIEGNPYTSLFAGDLCPEEFHGMLPGYNCY